MHDHDFDLIAALAEGDLEPQEAAAAERDIAACDECRTELAAQRVALAAIADATRPGLSMAESAELRRAVRTAIGVDPEPEPEPRRRPWLGLATAAAVVALLVAVVPAANLLRTDSDTAASDTTIDSGAFATTVPPATEAPASESAAAEAPTTEAAAAQTEDLAGAADRDLVLPWSRLSFESVDELDELLAEIAAGIEVDGTTRSLNDAEFRYYTDRLQVTPEEAPTGCPLTAVTDEVPAATSVVTVGIGEVDGIVIVIVAASTDDGVTTALALDTGTCEVVGRVDG